LTVSALFVERLPEKEGGVGDVLLILNDGLLIGFEFLLTLLERVCQGRSSFRIVALIESRQACFVRISCLITPGADGCVYIFRS
jgi:hypothetical protein